MRCKYCRNLFDGRKRECPECGKDRHYDGPKKRRSRSVSIAGVYGIMAVMPIMMYAMHAEEKGRKKGHEEAKEKLEELE